MGEIIPEVLVLASAFRQAFEMDANPGNTVQSSQNPTQIHLSGFFNFERAALAAYRRLQEHLNAVAAAAEAEAKKILAAAEAEAKKLLDSAPPVVVPPAPVATVTAVVDVTGTVATATPAVAVVDVAGATGLV